MLISNVKALVPQLHIFNIFDLIMGLVVYVQIHHVQLFPSPPSPSLAIHTMSQIAHSMLHYK